jgi:large subunit ribosomal protein L15
MGTTLHTLTPNKGATKNKKRLGRGHGSGLHKTSGKGQKGQKARTGHHGLPKPGFEGGQTMMARRIPKRGFTNHAFRKDIFAVNLGDIAATFPSGTVDLQALKDAGLVPRSKKLVKILADGEIKTKLTLKAHFFSASAKEKLEGVGGTAEVIAAVENGGITPAPTRHRNKAAKAAASKKQHKKA